MKQKRLDFDDFFASDTVAALITQIAEDPDYAAAEQALLLVFAPKWDMEALGADLERIREALPGLTVAGATTLGSNNPDVLLPKELTCTLLLFEHEHFAAAAFDCTERSPHDAGVEQVQLLAELPEPAKALLVLSADVKIYPAELLDVVSTAHPELPIVGEAAGKSLLDAPDDSFVWLNGQILRRGFVTVTFFGNDLQVEAQHNLGWRPIGRTLYVTRTEGIGEVTAIDGEPALSMYQKYLGVLPDENFYDNVCSFPLLERSGSQLIARVPYAYNEEDGALLFSMRMNENVPLTLSYSRPEYVLRESLASANAMAEFQPQAVLLFACINRRIFMGNWGADREFGYYERVQPAAVWAYGAGEIFVDGTDGGVLNSSLVALGLREGEAREEDAPEPYVDPELLSDSSIMPLAERMVTFLEATTDELHETIGTLEVLAERDELTGIFNRRRTEKALGDALETRRPGEPIAVLMYDIDFFKHVNDTYGHDIGDFVLRNLSQVVASHVRGADVLGRWGGEEFLIISVGTTAEGALHMANRIREAVAGYDFGEAGQVTISFGVTEVRDGDTAASAFARADAALYDAKRSGRNKVCVR